MRNWKTTLSGAISSALYAAITIAQQGTISARDIIIAAGVAFIGYFAKDFNVNWKIKINARSTKTKNTFTGKKVTTLLIFQTQKTYYLFSYKKELTSTTSFSIYFTKQLLICNNT